MEHLKQRAATLIEALPYIRQFHGKTIVVKYGGSAMESAELKRAVAQDIVLMHYVGIRPIVVHGGGARITEMMDRLGKKAEFVKGLRVSDRETVEIAQMVLVGTINKEIVSLLNVQGVQAVGLSGQDANLIRAVKMETDGDTDLGFVGEVESVNADLLKDLAERGYVAVVSCIGVGPEGESYNINADHVAGRLAAAVGAEKLVNLTDVPGILRDPDDPDSLISRLTLAEAKEVLNSDVISRGMIPKVESLVIAVEGGVPRAHIIHGRVPHALLIELFTDAGIGTMVVRYD
ncbi:MAG: acetylglutamate kinase [Armatimonadota bacterium]